MKKTRAVEFDKRLYDAPNTGHIDLLCAAVYEVIKPVVYKGLAYIACDFLKVGKGMMGRPPRGVAHAHDRRFGAWPILYHYCT